MSHHPVRAGRHCTKQGCTTRTFMDTQHCFDHQQTPTSFKVGFTAVLIVNLALLALAVWAVIELVSWVTAR